MPVSSGNLDSLLSTSYPDADFTGIATKSWTGLPQQTPSGTGVVSSVTLTTTGAPAPGTTKDETLKIVAVNDMLNTVALQIVSGTKVVGQFTETVLGFNPQGLLISDLDVNTASLVFSLGDLSLFDGVAGVLSSAPIPAQTNITFTATGSFDLAAAPMPAPAPTSIPTPGLSVRDTTTGQQVIAIAQPYAGPVSGPQQQYVNVTPDSLNITATTPNWFIHGGGGADAIDVSKAGGTNVLDGSTGSNFLTGGSGNDTFFLDDRNPLADVFSTVVGFHSGDNATVFGVNPTDFTVNKLDNQGAAGFTGLDFAFSAPGRANANILLAGFSSADLNNGRLTTTYGTTPDLPGLPGSQYLLIHAN